MEFLYIISTEFVWTHIFHLPPHSIGETYIYIYIYIYKRERERERKKEMFDGRMCREFS